MCDTNVLISGILFGGNARNVLDLISKGIITNFVSSAILQETKEVLARPKFGLKPEEVSMILELFKDTFEMVVPKTIVQCIDNDPDDDRILEAAGQAQADYIITGDNHLLALFRWNNIEIISPREFMDRFQAQ